MAAVSNGMPRPWVYFEDFAVGETHRYGGIAVSEEDIIRFASEFDPQYFHTDPVAAVDSAFGGLAASGWHTTSLLMRMIVDEYMNSAAALASPGSDEIRWLRPLRPGDTLYAITEIVAAIPSRSRPDRGLVKALHTVVNQDEQPVMTMLGLGFFKRRTAPK